MTNATWIRKALASPVILVFGIGLIAMGLVPLSFYWGTAFGTGGWKYHWLWWNEGGPGGLTIIGLIPLSGALILFTSLRLGKDGLGRET